jgi:hypothetical protein
MKLFGLEVIQEQNLSRPQMLRLDQPERHQEYPAFLLG